jgi:hypothetical protein
VGPFPTAVALGGQFLFGFATLCLVGLHLALAAVRYLSVTWFSRIHPADYQRLARRIYLTIGGIALVLIAAIMPIRASAEKTRNIESYLLGVAAPGANQMRYPLGFGGAALLGMGVSYLVSKRILQRRALARYLQYKGLRSSVFSSVHLPVSFVAEHFFTDLFSSHMQLQKKI